MTSFLTRAALGSLICFTIPAFADSAQEDCPSGKKHYRLSARHIEGGGVGYRQGYTTLETFLAPDPERWSVMPFLDARGHVFDNGKWAANAGTGIRGVYGCRAYGLNAFYDYRNTKRQRYNQIGVGLETLGTLWDFRMNGYLPVGRKITSPYHTKFDRFSDHHMILSRKYQFAMKGADAEVGFHFGKTRLFDFYTAAGPYYYIGEVGGNTWGGKARISGTFKDYVTLELSDSYDRRFHNNFQGQITLSIPFGKKSSVNKKGCRNTCELASALVSRMVQPVGREEIIVVGREKKDAVATDPATGEPLFFVFVENTSSSDGTYESPYPTLALAQANSKPGDIIYVFPGNGTTTGMDSGILLKADQKFWGSGVGHSIQTSQGTISIPAQSSSSPIITNTNIDTDGNAITLASNNVISGFTISSSMNDAIFGPDSQNLEVSSCTFENTNTFAIEATFSNDASISVMNNQFLNNTNGIHLVLNGASTLAISSNTFQGQTSISEPPIAVALDSAPTSATFENNVFNDNETGSVNISYNGTAATELTFIKNTFTNNRTGSASTLGSNIVLNANGNTVTSCNIDLVENTFSGNSADSLYIHTSGAITDLNVAASGNTMSNNGASALVFASGCTNFSLNATNNTLTELNDNGISIIGGTPFQTANITISSNTITDIGNSQNAIALSQAGSTLNFTAENNTIERCEGSGILCFSDEFTNMTANITNNVISNCQNGGGNAASGISLDTYVNLRSTIANNTLLSNASPSIALGLFTTGDPTVCLTLTGNSTSIDPGYSLSNPGTGAFNLSPCNVDTVNIGTITEVGVITAVDSCPSGALCPP
ncbi:MAG: right-handed parallel beta-helix repeat-containing protein [Chlamydiales bacterium]|nr:right-handed parallel beta-helix repeat-containing protein [Chlamydiales bacterium]